MSRVHFEDEFRKLLMRVEPRKLELGVEILLRKMSEKEAQGVGQEAAFRFVYDHAKSRVEEMLRRAKACEIDIFMGQDPGEDETA